MSIKDKVTIGNKVTRRSNNILQAVRLGHGDGVHVGVPATIPEVDKYNLRKL